MKHLNHCAAIALATTLLVSCSEENPWGNAGAGRGSLQLSIEALGDVEAAVPAVRAITTDVVTPPASAFRVNMVKNSGGYSKSWSSMEEFAKEESFPVGNYTLSVSYGNEKSQGRVLPSPEEEGYEHAQYYGETEVAVREGQTTEVRLSATLKNAIVVIEYTDAFNNYFHDVNTILQTSGNSPIELGANEAMNYVQPGEMNITMTAVQQNGKQVSLNPGKFTVEGQHMYKLRYNVYNGEVGTPVFQIEFDESLNTEPIEVDLTDELESTKAPEVTTSGFESGDEIEALYGVAYEKEAKYVAVADGGIASAVLTISSDTYHPSYLTDGQIDLCQATPAQQAAMEADGIKALGFFGNRDKMGQLDLSGLFAVIPEGVHTFTFQVSDVFSQVNEPSTFSLTCVPPDIAASSDDVLFGSGIADIVISYNGPAPTMDNNPFSFTTKLSNGMLAPCEVRSIEKLEDTRSEAFPSHNYRYHVALPDIEFDEFDVNIAYNNVKMPDLTQHIKFIYEEYQGQILFDAMATQLRWKAAFENQEMSEIYEKRLRVFVGDEEKVSTYDSDIQAFVITGLEPGKTYEVKTTVQSGATPDSFGSTDTVIMEEATPVPNGDFSATNETIKTNLQVGGPWKAWGNRATYCDMQYSEPDGGWASINAKTFCTNSIAQNTWFVVASTFMDGDGIVKIRSVAYDHDGTVPAQSGSSMSMISYCTNYPSNIANRSAGELFLGTYEFDYNKETKTGTETRTDGYDFSSRPSVLVFNYSYSPYKSDNGLVEMKIIASDGTEIGSVSENLSGSSTKEFRLNMPKYKKFGIKAAKLMIRFASSAQTPVLTRENSEIDLSLDSKSAGGTLPGINSTHTFSSGSELTISNLRFEY